MSASDISYQYTFRLENGAQKTFDARLDPRTLSLESSARSAYPEWTALGCNQCPNCPLSAAEQPRCPIAANLVDLVDFFGQSPSYEEVEVQLRTEERRYGKRTSVQRAVSSLIGIYMVTSGCPIMDKLRPMVRFHLPFSTAAETTYRVISMYLMAQYMRRKKGLEPDWELRGLVALYDDIHQVNVHFLERLGHIETSDASANAIIILDCFANQVQLSIDESELREFEVLFEPYLEA